MGSAKSFDNSIGPLQFQRQFHLLPQLIYIPAERNQKEERENKRFGISFGREVINKAYSFNAYC